jgi:KDO2-lipid IV(A) lauroyltransferase
MPRPGIKRLRHLLEYGLLRAASFGAVLFPSNRFPGFWSGVGRASAPFFPGRRRIALANLRLCLPPQSAVSEAAILAAAAGHLGLMIGERLGRLSTRLSSVSVQGREHLQAAVRRGRGIIPVTAHWGSWELLGAWLAREAIRDGTTCHTFAQILQNPLAEQWLAGRRSRDRLDTLSPPAGFRKACRALQNKEWVGLLWDQDAGSRGETGVFCNQRVSISGLPGRLSRFTGAPILPLFLFRLPEGTFRLEICPAWIPGSGPLPASEYFHSFLEQRLRNHPEQWFGWFHRRFKTFPPVKKPHCPV